MNPNYEPTQSEKRLLKALRTPKNNDGFFEMLMADYEITAESFPLFLENFNDENVGKCIRAIYSESKSPAMFRKKMRALAQVSIQEKVTEGIATYDFIKNVAFVTDIKWLKSMIKPSASQKVLVLYFFKKIEDCLDKPKQTRKKVLKEYTELAKKKSNYVINVLSEENSLIFLDENVERYIINALRKSF